jgi:hypothetical protein
MTATAAIARRAERRAERITLGVMSRLRSGPFAAWTSAWLAGAVSADDVLAAVRGADASHQVRPVPPASATAVIDLLATWRRAAAPVRLVLPVPGDVRGLPVDTDVRAAALEAGEAVVGGGLTAVPQVFVHEVSSAPSAVVWEAFAVGEAVAHDLQLGEAQHDLTTAIRECATALAAAGVAGAAGDVGPSLGSARRAGERLNLPPGWPPRAVALLAQAERLQAVLDLAEDDPVGGAIDRAGITARQEALRPLATAVRRARMAAYNANLVD